ncbi:MAG: TRAP transporter small permease subunit [Silicimonas sp.]|jgi:TRAP-type C4-dicarboxylate transport system permease small subunit|uniref:TRAP transporter small permease subunit n=1 Tax=Roseitalea porphyridii TaxID=1852022 RepID=UPI0032EB8F16
MAERMLAILRSLNRWVALVVGLMFLACAGLVLVDIALRHSVASLGGTDEISGYVMAIGTAWGMGYAMLELSHVRIDILRSMTGTKVRALFDIAAMMLMAAAVSVIAYWSWPVVAATLRNSSRANTPLETPLVLVQVPWFAGWIWFAVMAWLTLFAALMLLAQGRFDKAERAIGLFLEHEAL